MAKFEIESDEIAPGAPSASTVDARAERTMLAGLLHLAGALDEVRDLAKPEDCHGGANRDLYRAIVYLVDHGDALTEQAIASHLTRRKVFDSYGGEAWLASFREHVPTLAALRSCATYVGEVAVARRIVEACQRIAADGLASTDEPKAFADRSAVRFADVAENRTSTRVEIMWDVVDRRMAEWKSMREGVLVPSVPTGFASVDAATEGMPFGSVSFVGALTGSGKSIYAWQVANHVAGLRMGEDVGAVCYVSGEMNGGELVDRGVCARGGISYRSFRRVVCGAKDRPGESPLHESEIQNVEWSVHDAAEKLASAPMTIFAKIGGINDIRAALRETNRKLVANTESGHKAPKVRLLVVDYVQIMRMAKSERTDIALGEFAMELKSIAESQQLAVMCLSQVNKSSKSNPLSRPQTEDLKNASALSDAAHTVMFVHRPWRHMEGKPDRDKWKTYAEFLFTKGRSHESGAIPMRFEGERLRFVEPSPGEFAHLKMAMDEGNGPKKAYAPGSKYK